MITEDLHIHVLYVYVYLTSILRPFYLILHVYLNYSETVTRKTSDLQLSNPCTHGKLITLTTFLPIMTVKAYLCNSYNTLYCDYVF